LMVWASTANWQPVSLLKPAKDQWRAEKAASLETNYCASRTGHPSSAGGSRSGSGPSRALPRPPASLRASRDSRFGHRSENAGQSCGPNQADDRQTRTDRGLGKTLKKRESTQGSGVTHHSASLVFVNIFSRLSPAPFSLSVIPP
jgi:hypothetical protein